MVDDISGSRETSDGESSSSSTKLFCLTYDCQFAVICSGSGTGDQDSVLFLADVLQTEENPLGGALFIGFRGSAWVVVWDIKPRPEAEDGPGQDSSAVLNVSHFDSFH